MNWEPLALIITALGGFELIRYLAEWRSRRRQSEFHILEETIQFLQQEIKESVQREAEMTDRIYSLNSKLLEAEKKISGLMLELQRKRCDKLACRHRQPPNEYTPPDGANDDLQQQDRQPDQKKIPPLPDRIDFSQQ